jgi:ABC-type phosphate/phosphonate transport system substrate-binding protein
MRRRAFLGLCGGSLAGLLPFPNLALAQSEGIKVGLTGTIFPGLSDSMLSAAARPFKSLLEQATGVTGSIVQGGSARGLAAKLQKDEVQLGVFQGVEFAWARVANAKLEPIVICVNQTRTVRAFLIVRSASSISKVADLKNKSLILPVETREHCKVFLERRCVAAASSPSRFYKKILEAADVEEALDEVVDGRVTAAVVDSLPWSSYKKGKPGCARKLRVLEVSEPFPAAAVACQAGRFNASQLRRFRSGLIASKDSAKGKKMMEFLRITGFETVPDDYEGLLTAVAKAYPPVTK